MLKRRQQFIFGFFGRILFLVGLFLFVWWLPVLLLRLFPGSMVTSQDPWLLNPQDLTWKRSLVNMATKPGFRSIPAVASITIFIIVEGLIVFFRSKVRRVKWQLLESRLNEMRLRQSMEWVMDGNRPTAFSEYARWLRVLR